MICCRHRGTGGTKAWKQEQTSFLPPLLAALLGPSMSQHKVDFYSAASQLEATLGV